MANFDSLQVKEEESRIKSTVKKDMQLNDYLNILSIKLSDKDDWTDVCPLISRRNMIKLQLDTLRNYLLMLQDKEDLTTNDNTHHGTVKNETGVNCMKNLRMTVASKSNNQRNFTSDSAKKRKLDLLLPQSQIQEVQMKIINQEIILANYERSIKKALLQKNQERIISQDNIISTLESQIENVRLQYGSLLKKYSETFLLPKSDNQNIKNTILPKLSRTSKFLWDPTESKDWENVTPSTECLSRIKKDLTELHNDPSPGVFAIQDKKDLTVVHALIIGSEDTPYEGGFFSFIIRFPPDYPNYPPRVKLLTTGEEKVRLNPNFYANGKICLSIIGTCRGPKWNRAHSLSSLLESIESIMNKYPYSNEAGCKRKKHTEESTQYNEVIRHETLRVAVCDTLEENAISYPLRLRKIMEQSFPKYYRYYTLTALSRLHWTSREMNSRPHGEKRCFDYITINNRLKAINTRLNKKQQKQRPQ